MAIVTARAVSVRHPQSLKEIGVLIHIRVDGLRSPFRYKDVTKTVKNYPGVHRFRVQGIDWEEIVISSYELRDRGPISKLVKTVVPEAEFDWFNDGVIFKETSTTLSVRDAGLFD